MIGKILMFVIVIGFVIFVFLKISEGKKKVKNSPGERLRNVIDEKKKNREVAINNGPEIQYARMKDNRRAEPYKKVVVSGEIFKIGRNPHCDLVLPYSDVDERHAVIFRKYDNQGIYYEIINNSRKGLFKIYDREQKCWTLLRPEGRIRMDIDSRNAICLGDCKLIIDVPNIYQSPSKTELFFESDDEEEETEDDTIRF